MKTKPKKLSFKEFKTIYSKVPRLCVDLIIKTENRILLSKRDIEPSKGYWHFPGGTVLLRESLKDTIDRVAKEETSLKIKINKMLGTIEYLESSPHFHTITIAYLAKPVSGKLRGSRQGKELKYFKKIPPKTIPEQKAFLIRNKLLK